MKLQSRGLWLLSICFSMPLSYIHGYDEQRCNIIKTLQLPETVDTSLKVFNQIDGGYTKMQLGGDVSISLPLDLICPIGHDTFARLKHAYLPLVVAAVETEEGSMRFYNGVHISSWLLNKKLTAPKRHILCDPMNQSIITNITYFILRNFEEGFQFLCTLEDLTENNNAITHKFFRYLLLAIDGDPGAQNTVSLLYTRYWQKLDFDSYEDCISLALPFLQAAAEQGFAPAQFNLGCKYEKYWQILGFNSQEEGIRQACPLLHAAAEQEYPRAQCYLGLYYKNYWKVLGFNSYEEGIRQAFPLLQAAAYQNLALAQSRLGRLYHKYWHVLGLDSHKEGIRLAIPLYQAAANQNHPEAQNGLGVLYDAYWQILGLNSREEGIRQALPFYEAAANQKNKFALERLAELHRDHWKILGHSSQADGIQQARNLFETATELGFGWGHNHLAMLLCEHWQDLDLPYEEAIRQAAHHFEQHSGCNDCLWSLRHLYSRHPFILNTPAVIVGRCNIL